MDEDDVVQGIVVMRKGENPGEVIDALKTKIEDINKNVLPKDVQIVPFYDREDLVSLAVRTVTHNLIEGILLVTFIVLIFMADWRTTVVVAVVIPLALLFAFICLRAMGDVGQSLIDGSYRLRYYYRRCRGNGGRGICGAR